MLCPKCSAPRKGGVHECPECGVIYSKAKAKPTVQAKKLYSPYSILGWGMIFLVFIGYNTYDWWEAKKQAELAKIEAAKPPLYSQWNDDPADLNIVKTLIKNKVGGCADLRWKVDFQHPDQYLVACSRDSINWKYYKIDTKKISAIAVKI